MVKIYAFALLLSPILAQTQQLAFAKPVPPGFPTTPIHYVADDENRVATGDFQKNIGKEIKFCGRVYLAKQQKDELGPHSVIFVAGDYVNECAPLKVRFQDGNTLSADICKNLSFKDVCITGTVVDEFGEYSLFVDSTSMQSLVTDAKKPAAGKGELIIQDRELKVLANAYLLAGPRWKDPVLSFLKAGSVVIAEEVRGSWAFVRIVAQDGRDVQSQDLSGYMNTKHLGLNSKGFVAVPQ